MNRQLGPTVMVLAALLPNAHAQQAISLSEQQAQGRHLLAQSCGICHLQPARGSVTYGPILNKASTAGNDEVMRTLILSGTDRMPSFRHYLKPDEIDAIIAYVRTVPAPPAVASNDQKKGEAK